MPFEENLTGAQHTHQDSIIEKRSVILIYISNDKLKRGNDYSIILKYYYFLTKAAQVRIGHASPTLPDCYSFAMCLLPILANEKFNSYISRRDFCRKQIVLLY